MNCATVAPGARCLGPVGVCFSGNGCAPDVDPITGVVLPDQSCFPLLPPSTLAVMEDPADCGATNGPITSCLRRMDPARGDVFDSTTVAEVESAQSIPPAGRFLQVPAGVTYTCGLRPDYSIDCWGGDPLAPTTADFMAGEEPCARFRQVSTEA